MQFIPQTNRFLTVKPTLIYGEITDAECHMLTFQLH